MLLCKEEIKPMPSPQSLPELQPDIFNRCASLGEAIDLLGHAFECTKSLHYRGYSDLDDFTALDRKLQALLGQLLQNSTHSWEESCESIGLIFG
jgi:hypothetical protein